MDTTKRDLFERTTRERLGLKDDHDLRRSALIPDDYADPDTQRMWAGWQLAAQALAATSADGRGTDAQIEKKRETQQNHAAAPVQAASPDDLIRVAVFGFGSCELYAKYEHIQHEVESHLDDGVPVPDDSPTYTLTFKTITRAEFDAMGEFDGF